MNALMQHWGTSQTETLTVVIDRIYQQEERTMNTRPNTNAGPSKFHLGDRVVTAAGCDGEIVSVLPRLETFYRGEWIADREYAYKVNIGNTIVIETESDLSE